MNANKPHPNHPMPKALVHPDDTRQEEDRSIRQLKKLVESGDLKRVEKMLKEGAKTESVSLACYPLHHAAVLEGSVGFSMVDLFLGAGANVNAKGNFGWSTLHHVCANDRVDMVKHLVLKGADFMLKAGFNETPMHIAMQHNAFKCMELLLSLGADPDAKNFAGISLRVNKDYPQATEFYHSWARKVAAKKALEEINESIEVAKIGPGHASHLNLQSGLRP